ncbi:MAG: hypothetical protein EWM47_09520 [Anaerolineaceae bacterium]|nr:MAG: hypothetical protein EWM47_09520 [Anaerolineaceae bacterium]
MEKVYEKKNFGIPVTILIILAYFIGFSLVRSLSGTLLIAILFAGAVFSLQFDDKVKNAVKHSYIFATLFHLLYFLFDILESFINMVFGGRFNNINNIGDFFYEINFFQRAFNALYTYGLLIVDIALVVIFGLFIIMALFKKDMNLFFVKTVLGEAAPKPKKQASTYNQPPVAPYGQPPVSGQPHAPQGHVFQKPQAPVNQQPPAPQAPVNQQIPVPQAPVNQQPPVSPAAPQPAQPQMGDKKLEVACPSCGNLNNSQAKFCASCGSIIK